MTAPPVSVICCEGYHDRAFWAGWLEHLRWIDPGKSPENGERLPVPDPWLPTRIVKGGHFLFRSPTSPMSVLIIPCKGVSNVLREARRRLKGRATEPLAQVVVNLDIDAQTEAAATTAISAAHASIEHTAKQFDPAASKVSDGIFVIGGDGGPTTLSSVLWWTDDPPGKALPDKQTLERLVTAAILTAYPDRAQAVEHWLASRPAAPAAGPKAHAWSHMAGWYAENGCEDFYREVWRDRAIAGELEARLRRSGAWQAVEALAA